MSSEHIRTMVEAGKQLLLPIDFSKMMSLQSYLKECRTIDLKVPRRSGKTTYIIEEAKEISSLVMVHNRGMEKHYLESGVPTITSHIEPHAIRGISGFGLKLHCLFIDEADYIRCEDIDTLLSILFQRNLLAKDFYIVKLGT